MDSQPGVIIPHDNDSKPNASQQPAAEASREPARQAQPTTQPPAPVENTAQAAPVSTGAPGSEQFTPGEGRSLYAPDGPGSSPDGQTAGWQYNQEADPASLPQPSLEDLTWTASEFIEHPKGFGWYSLLGLAGLAVAALNYLVTRDVVSTGAIVIAAVLFGIYASHKPRTQQYHLSPQGLQIGSKLYVFQTFKAFSVADEGATASILFTPLGRFAPPITIYVARDMEEQVLSYVGNFLPLEQHRTDAVDGLLRRIRF